MLKSHNSAWNKFDFYMQFHKLHGLQKNAKMNNFTKTKSIFRT